MSKKPQQQTIITKGTKMDEVSDFETRKLKTKAYYTGANFNDFPSFFQKYKDINSIKSNILQILIDNETSKLRNEKFKNINRYKYKSYFLDFFKKISVDVEIFFAAELNLPNLFLVDKLPGKFRNRQWDSMSIDAGDEKRTGIGKGIYYINTALTHPYFEFIITHELIHWTISHYSENYFPYTNLLEEGVCDYLSYFILLRTDTVSKECINNFIIFNRVTKSQESLWYNYYRFSKLVLNISNSNGIEFLVEKVKKGRAEINKLINCSKNLKLPDEDTFSLHSCFDNSESIVILKPNEYFLLKKIIDDKLQKFTLNELEGVELYKQSLIDVLESLVSLSFISYSGEAYYQSFEIFPNNIKFDACE